MRPAKHLLPVAAHEFACRRFVYMLCAFCGLETGRASSHETQEACIGALREQVTHLKDVLEHARRPGEDMLVPSATPEPRADSKSPQET